MSYSANNDHLRLFDNLAVRLANEGVPLAAIARVTALVPADVRKLVEAAIARGAVRSLPAEEWPAGSLVTARAPTVPPIEVESVDELAFRITTTLGLHGVPARVLAALLLHGRLSRRALVDLSNDGRPINKKSIDTIIYDARRALRGRKAAIVNIYGRGFHMEEADRDRLLEELGWPLAKAPGGGAAQVA